MRAAHKFVSIFLLLCKLTASVLLLLALVIFIFYLTFYTLQGRLLWSEGEVFDLKKKMETSNFIFTAWR